MKYITIKEEYVKLYPWIIPNQIYPIYEGLDNLDSKLNYKLKFDELIPFIDGKLYDGKLVLKAHCEVVKLPTERISMWDSSLMKDAVNNVLKGNPKKFSLTDETTLKSSKDLRGIPSTLCEKPTKQSEGTIKFDEGKPCISDIPQKSLISLAKVFNYGANKYSKFNYLGGTDWLRYYDACQRHLNSWIVGEDIDESTNNHIDHAIASLMMLRENIHLNKGKDNRSEVYKQLNK